MGGGGAMRTAAKVAGYGAYSGFRNLPAVPLSEQAAATGRKCPPAVTTIASAGEILSSTTKARIDAAVAVQKPLWEIDDWQFAGGEEAELFDSSYPPSRVVFGGVPTMEEAREATSDLKEALEKVYFSSPTVTGAEGSSRVVPGSYRSGSLSVENPETKACVTSETSTILPSVPKPVLNAFYLLKESPEVQNVVASLAADKNVWEAVMKNDKVMEFYQSQAAVLHSHLNEDTEESANGYFTNSGHESVEQTSETSTNGLTWFMDNIKMRVAKMVSDLSEFFQNVIGNSAEESSSSYSKRSSADFVDKAIGVSFIALGILAIMVVLLKRK